MTKKTNDKSEAADGIVFYRGKLYWKASDGTILFEKGEVLGIIGANGAGKSTILKLLSRRAPF